MIFMAEAAKTPKAKLSRKTKKALGRKKRATKLKTDKEFAKAHFAAKSKRSIEKKAAFRKKKKGKK
jgi:hypothetical protein